MPLLRTAEVAIIYGEDSLRNKKEVSFVARRAKGMSRHLQRVGVTAEVFSDKNFKDALSKDCKTASLIMCQNPSKEFLAGINSFVGRGGKVCVFYSDSPALAQIMGVQIDKFVKLDGKEEWWERIVFAWPRPVHMPESYSHKLTSVLQVIPQKGGKVLGNWESSSKTKGPAAVIEVPNGFWVSFLPSEYANQSDYTYFVASIICGKDKSLWRSAAQKLRKEINESIPQKSVPALYEKYKHTPYPKVKQKLDVLRNINSEIDICFSKGLFAKAVPELCKLRKELDITQALLDGPVKLKVVAAWDKSTVLAHAKDKKAAVEKLKAAGVTDVYMEMAAPGWGRVSLPNHPLSKEKSIDKDLREMIALYKSAGIRTHAWIYSLSGEYMPQANWDTYKKRGMTIEGESEKTTIRWLNPSHPDVAKIISDTAIYLVKTYGFDGVHLDYVRYPDFPANDLKSISDKAKFMQYAKLKQIDWSKDIAIDGKYRQQYDKWRSKNVAGFVRSVGTSLKKAVPNVTFSTAVFGEHPKCVNTVGQDWYTWLDEGFVDFVVPMNYTTDMNYYRELVSVQSNPKYRDRVVSGIGVNSFEGLLNVTQVFHQLRFAGFKKLKGVSFYSLEEYLDLEVLPALELINDSKKK